MSEGTPAAFLCCCARSASICEHPGTHVTLHHLCCRCLSPPLASAAELQALSSLQDADNVTAAYHGIGTLAALKAHGLLQQKPPSQLLEQVISLLQQLVDGQGRWAMQGWGSLWGCVRRCTSPGQPSGPSRHHTPTG